MDYYPCQIQVLGNLLYLVWYSNATDGVVTQAKERKELLLAFTSFEDADSWCAKRRITLIKSKELGKHDFDAIANWTCNPKSEILDCVNLNICWNLLQDISMSLYGCVFDGEFKNANVIYNKIFWGTNPPSLMKSSKPYRTKLSQKELSSMTRIFQSGLRMLLVNIKISDSITIPEKRIVRNKK